MKLSRRDLIATTLVMVALLLYLLWAADQTWSSMSGTRATGLVILALGFLASASAVVPSFDQLLHGSRMYMAITSAIGAVAAIAGVHMLVTASDVSLAVVMLAMVVLWLIATVHHTMLANDEPHGQVESEERTSVHV